MLLGEPLGGLVIDDLVDRLEVSHGSPVGGKEAGMTGCGDNAVVLLNLFEWDIQEVEAECRPGVDGQAGGDSRLVLGQAGAEKAHRSSHRSGLAGPGAPTPIGRWGASGWLNFKWTSACSHNALPDIGLYELRCPVSGVRVFGSNASHKLACPGHNVAGWFENVGVSELKDPEVASSGAVIAYGSCDRSGQALKGFLGRSGDLAAIEGHGKNGGEDHLDLGASVPGHVGKPRA